MKSFLLAIIILAASLATTPASAGPPCYSTSRYGEWVKVTKKGVVSYRYSYRGKTNGFPPPAMYYYGYPGSGFSYGMGF